MLVVVYLPCIFLQYKVIQLRKRISSILLPVKISHRNKLSHKSKINSLEPLHEPSLILRFLISITQCTFLSVIYVVEDKLDLKN